MLVLHAREQSAVVHNGRLREGGRQAGARTRARRARCARQPQRVGRKAQAACHSCETRLQGVTRRRRAQPARTHYTQAAAVPRGAGRRPPSSPRTLAGTRQQTPLAARAPLSRSRARTLLARPPACQPLCKVAAWLWSSRWSALCGLLVQDAPVTLASLRVSRGSDLARKPSPDIHKKRCFCARIQGS